MRIFKIGFMVKVATFALTGLFVLTACQDRLIVENKGALGSNIVRLGDTAVASVDGTNIYLSDVERAAMAQKLIKPGEPLSPKDAIFQKVLDELIDQRLMALSALRRSLDQGDEAQRRLATPLNTLSVPFKSEFGWHVIEVLGRRKGKQPNFAEMRDEILNFMTYDEIQNLVKDLRDSGDVQLLFGQAIVDKPDGEATPPPELRESQTPE